MGKKNSEKKEVDLKLREVSAAIIAINDNKNTRLIQEKMQIIQDTEKKLQAAKNDCEDETRKLREYSDAQIKKLKEQLETCNKDLADCKAELKESKRQIKNLEDQLAAI